MLKEEVDILIRKGYLITMNENMETISVGAVAIKDGRILDVGKTDELDKKYSASKIIDANHTIVMPGLIDCHTHTCQQFLRGVVTNRILPRWKRILVPFESQLTADDAYYSALLTCINMIKVGTTCFAEAGAPHVESIIKAVRESGIRAILAKSNIDLDGDIPASMRQPTEAVIDENINLIKKWNNSEKGRIKVWLGLRQITVCSDKLYKEFKILAKKFNVGIHTHLAEGRYEIEFCYNKWKKRPVQYLYDAGFLGPEILAAHCVFLTDDEISMIRSRDVNVVHCPSANITFLGFPKMPQMLERGINVALGTDGGSIRNLDIFEEMRIAAIAHSGYYGLPVHDLFGISPEALVKMATINGAKALLCGQEIGSIERGKKADIIIVDFLKPHLIPFHNVYSNLVYAVSGQDVITAIVDGRIVMEDRQLLFIDEKKILKIALTKAKKALERSDILKNNR